jgi:hypothetical protein
VNAIYTAQHTTLASGATVEQWVAALKLHLSYGYVVSEPECFAMARPVWHEATLAQMLDFTHCFERVDCWFIHTAAGQLDALVARLPFDLPLLCWQRGDAHRPGTGRPLRFYRTDRVRSLAFAQPQPIPHHG